MHTAQYFSLQRITIHLSWKWISEISAINECILNASVLICCSTWNMNAYFACWYRAGGHTESARTETLVWIWARRYGDDTLSPCKTITQKSAHKNQLTNLVTARKQYAYPLSFSRPTMVLLKPHLGLSGVPFINSMTGSRVISCLSRSSRLRCDLSTVTAGNIAWNSPLATNSLIMSKPPTSSPWIYSWGYVGQLEYSFKPTAWFKPTGIICCLGYVWGVSIAVNTRYYSVSK